MSRHPIPFFRVIFPGLAVLYLYLILQGGFGVQAAGHAPGTVRETPSPALRFIPPASMRLNFLYAHG